MINVMYLMYYFSAISVISVIMTVCDKLFAIYNKHRISENALMCAASLGGACAMLITMLVIRHKTKHIKFMAGIPFIIAAQCVFACFIMRFINVN